VKNFFSSLFLVLILSKSAFALSTITTPNEFYVTEHWISYTTSFDIETKTQKLGTLYRRLLSLLLTYDFYDTNSVKIASARSKFFSLTAQFDVRDENDVLLGSAEETLFSFFPSFYIFSGDKVTKLAYASMNFWGTSFTIYDPATNQEMAVMSRPFFRLKNNWTVRITNPQLFAQKNIDSRVLMTVLAFQGDREYWEQQNRDKDSKRTLKANGLAKALSSSAAMVAKQTNAVLAKVSAVQSSQGIQQPELIQPEIMQSVANELQEGYDKTLAQNDINASTEEKMKRFTMFCLAQVESSTVPADKKQVILALLKMRLETGAV
jgi:hypothetical protein